MEVEGEMEESDGDDEAPTLGGVAAPAAPAAAASHALSLIHI